MEAEDRMFFSKTTIVDEKNADEIISKFIETQNPGYDYSDLEFCVYAPQEIK